MSSENEIVNHCKKCRKCGEVKNCLFRVYKEPSGLSFINIPIDIDRHSDFLMTDDYSLTQIMNGLEKIKLVMDKIP